MNELETLADRHLRPDPQGVLLPGHIRHAGRVLVSVDSFMATVAAGQHIAWMLVNLLARQFGVVSSITLDVPDASLIDKVAHFGDADSLRATLEQCVIVVAGNHVTKEILADDDEQFDVHFVVGLAPTTRRSERTWYLYADGWRWYVGRAATMPTVTPTRVLSFGPYLAACAAAGEAFKILRGIEPRKGEFIEDLFGSAWTMTLTDAWDKLLDGPDSLDVPEIRHAYFAGAGAVAQAAALALGSSRLSGSITTVDHGVLDITNDNRYVLSGKADDGQSKVGAVTSYLDRCGIPCNPVACKWQDYVSSLGRRAIDAAVGALERRSRFTTILSCVDNNDARYAIQNAVPELIVGGSTDGLTAKISVYSLGRYGACLKCFNSVEDRNAIITERLSMARDMAPDQQRELCQELGITIDELERLLTATGCGKLNEADLERFANELPQMSVGFVSAAAGVLLAAQLVRITALGIDNVLNDGQMVAMTFARPGLRHYKSARDETCDCGSRLRKTWQSLWSGNRSAFAAF